MKTAISHGCRVELKGTPSAVVVSGAPIVLICTFFSSALFARDLGFGVLGWVIGVVSVWILWTRATDSLVFDTSGVSLTRGMWVRKWPWGDVTGLQVRSRRPQVYLVTADVFVWETSFAQWGQWWSTSTSRDVAAEAVSQIRALAPEDCVVTGDRGRVDFTDHPHGVKTSGRVRMPTLVEWLAVIAPPFVAGLIALSASM